MGRNINIVSCVIAFSQNEFIPAQKLPSDHHPLRSLAKSYELRKNCCVIMKDKASRIEILMLVNTAE